MVLEDAGNSTDGFTDNPYPTDNDAYTTDHNSAGRYDASDLPQPIPILGPILGFPRSMIRFKTESTLKFAEQRLRRPLTAEEAHALAGHLYKLEQTKSYFTAFGASLGLWRWYSTMAICRYPLFQPKVENINPNKFLFVKGPAAHYVRHSWRACLYFFAAGELGKLCGHSIAQVSAAHYTAQDPRLEQFAHDLRAVMPPLGDPLKKPRQNSADERRAAWEAAVKANSGDAASPRPTPADDDMSPTSGNYSSGASTDDSSLDEFVYPSEQPVSPFTQQGRRPTRQEDDDASPTGGMFQDEVQNQSKPGESAWERLRRGGAPPTPGRPVPPQHREQKDGSTLGDSFTFGDSEESRNQERERAQREFDTRIEQERQGKDFNENKKW